MIQKRIYSYFERNPQLHVLFIFDRMKFIETELEGVKEWAEDYVYQVFDGAWFYTKYAIENTWKDKRVVLLFPLGTCPSTEEQQLKFPLLDMLKANMEYKEDDFEAYMQQYNLPAKYRSFIKRNVTELMTSKVSNILAGHVTAKDFNEDLACRAFVSSYLGEKRLQDWENILVKMIILGGSEDEKKRADFFYKLGNNRDAKRIVDEKLLSWFGCSYNPTSEVKMEPIAKSMKYNSITQLLEAATADNYKTYKVTNAVMLEMLNKVYEFGSHDRTLATRFTKALDLLASDIREEEIIKVYGIDAPYYNLTESLCWPILNEIVHSKLMTEPKEVNDRMRELTLKMPVGSKVLSVVKFIEHVALYYNQTKNMGSLKLNKADDYVKKYVEEYYLIDMYYRRSLEEYHALITLDVPIEDTLFEAKRQLDQAYAKLANVMNLEWLTCVKEQGEAFRGITLKRQENFYLHEGESQVKQAIIVSDALRYEVAVELMQQLAKEKHIATLDPYLAMLPSETKYCKPALLPHQSLELQGTDMLVDGTVLTTTEQRTSHLSRYKDHALCMRYEDAMNGDKAFMREQCKRPLVYIFHETIDEASHSQSPFEVIAACRKAIDQLAVLVKRLHSTWNVTNVVVTADHGFIYNDQKFEEKDKHSITEVTLEKKTRYYLTTDKTDVEGIMKFPLDEVSGIKGSGLYIAVPIGTNRLAAPGGYNFAHGGASLQEMIIPVIRSQQKRVNKTEKVGVALMNHYLTMVSSRLKFQLIQSEAVSMTLIERKVACQLFLGEQPVSAEKILTLNSTDAVNINNRVYEVTMTLNKSVSGSMIELRIYDGEDTGRLNPIIRETVKNKTMIEQDF
ncbi:MAG: BREX-1 system phosphatase PglZ type A [Parabacteroides sp.]|nr:BREX-1 system phosphatase PglZ type A [Parabacteroides sp.]